MDWNSMADKISLLRLNVSMIFVSLLLSMVFFSGCLRYSFSGASIPEGVNSIYIPFFANQTSSGVPDLSDRLNQALINRFINQSRLQLANNRGNTDAILEGAIVSYENAPFSVTGDDQADQNAVRIVVRGSFSFTNMEDKDAEYSKTFNGSSTYDPNDDPIQGENDAAQEALEQIANNMFNDAVSGW